MLDQILPYDLAAAMRRVPLHFLGFGALGFGFEFMTRHALYAPVVWILFFGGWRAYAEREDIGDGSDTIRKAAIDFASQFTGAVAGIFVAWRIH